MAIRDNYKNIDDSFSTGYENISNKELIHKHGQLPGGMLVQRENIVLEMNRRLIDEIGEFNETSSRQTKWIIRLTISLGFISLLQLILLFTQSLFIVSIPLLDLLTFPITSFLSN